MVFTHEGFDHAHIGQRLLDAVIERIQRGLHPGELRIGSPHDHKNAYAEQRNDDQQDQRKLPVQKHCHDEAAHQHAGAPESHAERHHDHHLDLLQVIGQTRDQGAGRKIVQIRKGKTLDLGKELTAEISCKAYGCAHRKIAAEHAAAYHQEACAEHDAADL